MTNEYSENINKLLDKITLKNKTYENIFPKLSLTEHILIKTLMESEIKINNEQKSNI